MATNLESNNKSLMTIRVTPEQREVIYAMWAHNDWDIEEVATQESQTPSNNITDFVIEQSMSDPECPFCLCRPCITSEQNRQMWWEQECHTPDEANSSLRKPMYRRFWTMLLHRRVWDDPRYIAKKESCLLNDPSRQITAWVGPRHHLRDIIPECVLKLVRGWYPNPPEKSYMGHKWT